MTVFLAALIAAVPFVSYWSTGRFLRWWTTRP